MNQLGKMGATVAGAAVSVMVRAQDALGGLEGSTAGESQAEQAGAQAREMVFSSLSTSQWLLVVAVTLVGAYVVGTLVFLWQKNRSRPAKAGGCGCLAGIVAMVLLQVVLGLAFNWTFGSLIQQ